MNASLGFAEWAGREQDEVQTAERRAELERTASMCVKLRVSGADASHWMN